MDQQAPLQQGQEPGWRELMGIAPAAADEAEVGWGEERWRRAEEKSAHRQADRMQDVPLLQAPKGKGKGQARPPGAASSTVGRLWGLSSGTLKMPFSIALPQ